MNTFNYVFHLNIPVIVVVTKIDIVKEQGLEKIFTQNMSRLDNLLKKSKRISIFIGQDTKLSVVDDAYEKFKLGPKEVGGNFVPVFHTSNVTGDGLDQLKRFIYDLAHEHELTKKLENYHSDL